MSGVPPPTQQQQPQSQPGGNGTQQSQQGLPPTGLQQQMNSLNQMYQGVQQAGQGQVGMGRMGYNVRASQFQQSQQGGEGELGASQQMGASSLDSIARNLATRYGMPIGKGRLVDEQGNFLFTPEQMSSASGGSMTMGEAAANMNYIAQALTNQKNEQQQQKGLAALQTGLSQVQSRGRGSMAAMTSGYYQDIANMESNKEYASADFSYYIQKEQQNIATELQRRQDKLVKKQAQGAFVAGIGTTIIGLYTGNLAVAAYGVSQVGGSAGSTGWF